MLSWSEDLLISIILAVTTITACSYFYMYIHTYSECAYICVYEYTGTSLLYIQCTCKMFRKLLSTDNLKLCIIITIMYMYFDLCCCATIVEVASTATMRCCVHIFITVPLVGSICAILCLVCITHWLLWKCVCLGLWCGYLLNHMSARRVVKSRVFYMPLQFQDCVRVCCVG